MLSLTPQVSLANEIGFEDTLVRIGNLEEEEQFTSSPDDVQRARLVIVINKAPVGPTAQQMRVYLDGKLEYEWLTSTGREQVEKAKSGRVYRTTTPIGYFRPTVLEENHFSNTWKANMPHSVFFVGGVAIHASSLVEKLGTRASGGCVRLAPENAAILYNMIQTIGMREVLTFDRQGNIVLDQDGKPVMSQNWDTLIIVENHI